MRKNEVRALAQAGALLLAVGIVRTVVQNPAGSSNGERRHSSAVEALIETSEAAAADAALRSGPLAPGERIDPNKATEEDLDRLPGIGPALARRIVAARDDGLFRSASDLGRVSGLGPKKLASLESRLVFSAPASGSRVVRRTSTGSESRSWDLSRMSARELETLDGIGPALAARIVDFRAQRGGLTTADELLDVPGIGPATLERILRSLELRSGG